MPEHVTVAGNQTVDGTKTFLDPPQVPAPVGDDDAVPKEYVDDGVAALATLGYGFDLVSRPGFADAATIDVQEFVGSGLWTKVDGARWVRAILVGGGGPGASGYRGAEGQDRYGGGGGGPAEVIDVWLDAADLDDAGEAVTVGTGGTGGVTNSTGTTGAGMIGNDGVIGTATVLDTIAGEISAAPGGIGTHASGLVPGSGGFSGGGQGGIASTYTALPATVRATSYAAGRYGGGGAGITRVVANTNLGNAQGGSTPVAAGGITASPGAPGEAAPVGSVGTGAGGGGGGAAAQAGGVGGYPGGGGGGGGYGSSATPNNSGVGGNGGTGYALIITYR